MRRSALIFSVIALLTFVAAANAQFSRGLGTLSGSVLDEQGKPVANASVTIQTSDGRSPHAIHTDVNGHFEFTRFDAGQYDVRAYSHSVFSDWSKRVVVRPKKTTEITLQLSPTAK
ncbi:MAG TPA: carboxypeptidase-like regulatory domain-containing protein [Candidatus Acidoferrales bacterium]|nr:carboxypeptidase-like regulatory domain-containing protein [Candidatus Acidoferrales bacterium]